MKKRHHIAVLDIGTRKVCCAVGELFSGESNYDVTLLTLSSVASGGIRKGKIVNHEEVERAVLSSIYSAERECGRTIKEIYLSIPSPYIKFSNVVRATSRSKHVVDDSDIGRLLASLEINNENILHAFPVKYFLDDEETENPVGMVGRNLKCYSSILSISNFHSDNIKFLVERCHVDVVAMVASSYASSLAVLDDEEINFGSVVVDIGAGNTSIASFQHGNLVNFANISVGGNLITNDISHGLGISFKNAERLKTLYGSFSVSGNYKNRDYDFIKEVGNILDISNEGLSDFICPRVDEIIDLIEKAIKVNNFDACCLQRIVLTGGTSQLPGLQQAFQSKFRSKVRVGLPRYVKNVSKDVNSIFFASLFGLFRYASCDIADKQWTQVFSKKKNWWQKIGEWAK